MRLLFYKLRKYQTLGRGGGNTISSNKYTNNWLEAIVPLVFARLADGGLEEVSPPAMIEVAFPISLRRASGEPGLTRIP